MASAWQAHTEGRSPKEVDDMVDAALTANEASASSGSSASPLPANPALPAAWVSAPDLTSDPGRREQSRDAVREDNWVIQIKAYVWQVMVSFGSVG